MKKQEIKNRNELQENKPLVYSKIIKYPNLPRIQFIPDYRCNFSCSHCSIKPMQKKTTKVLSIDEIEDIFSQADAMGISRMTLSGGEPLIFPNLDEIIKAIGSERFYMQLDTNSYHLTPEVAEHLKKIGIDVIAPSLDSLSKEDHDAFRNKKGSADRVLNSVQIAKKVNLKIYIQTVLTKTRLYTNEFIDFIKYFNDQDVGVYVSFAKPVGEFSGKFEEVLNRKDLDYFRDEIESKYNVFSHLSPAYGINEERHCVASKNIFSITAYGDVLPCIFFYCSMGNVKNEPLKDIYERCIKLKIFQKDTCVIGDTSDSFIDKYLVDKIYGKDLPVDWKEVFKPEDFL